MRAEVLHTGGAQPSPGRAVRWVRAGHLIDGRAGAAKQNIRIGLSEGRIAHIGPDGHGRPDDDSLDLSAATVLPALIDAHVHLVFSGILDAKARAAQLQHTPEQAEAAIRRHLQHHLRWGVAAVRDGGDHRGDVLQYKRRNTDGFRQKVHVAACRAWHAAGRYGAMIGQASPPGVRLAQAAHPDRDDPDHIKLIQSGLNSIEHFGQQSPPQFETEDLRALVQAAHAAGKPVMVHANGERGVRMAVEAGCDSIEHGYFMGGDNLRRMADKGTVWVPTAVPMAALAGAPGLTPSQRDVARRTLDAQLEQIRKAREYGVTIALGTDAGSQGVDHGRAVRQELSLLMAAGWTLEEAVACATGRAAGLIGLTDRGELVVGRRADFIAVPGPPQRLPGSLDDMIGICLEGEWQESQKARW